MKCRLVGWSTRFSGHAAATIGERQWHPGQTIEEQADGTVIARFRTNQQSQVLFWVSQWGPQAEILEPAELRERVRGWFAEASALSGVISCRPQCFLG